MAPLKSLVLATMATLTSADLFTLTISQPGGPFNGQKVNAAGNAFYVGLTEPATYCPTQVEPNCPVVTGTVFATAIDSLWVEVPGGQRTYVRPEGPLGFTQAHSAFIPPGSFQGGWVNLTVFDLPPETLHLYTWQQEGAGKGIALCPTATEGVLQVNVITPGFVRTDCTEVLGLKPITQVGNEFGAWQYT